jgi:hypothetical protein
MILKLIIVPDRPSVRPIRQGNPATNKDSVDREAELFNIANKSEAMPCPMS